MPFLSGRKLAIFLAILSAFTLSSGDTSGDNTSKVAKDIPRKRSLVALLYTTNSTSFTPDSRDRGKCRWLRGLKHQRKMCQQKRELPEILQETRKFTLNSCRKLFQYDHWNCSSTNMKKFFKKMYRETAFMYSLATSAFMYVMARACSEGRVASCKCITPDRIQNGTYWQWGGCGYSTKFARRYTKKFLQLKKEGDSFTSAIKHNSEVGIKVVLKHERTHCKCHGFAGSCSYKICIKRLDPFDKIALKLKELYHRAVHIEPKNNLHRKKRSLVYSESSPNYCDLQGGSGLSTVGRRCRDIDNCATLCCGRDYEEIKQTMFEFCHCRWSNETLCKLQCDQCPIEEIGYYCK